MEIVLGLLAFVAFLAMLGGPQMILVWLGERNKRRRMKEDSEKKERLNGELDQFAMPNILQIQELIQELQVIQSGDKVSFQEKAQTIREKLEATEKSIEARILDLGLSGKRFGLPHSESENRLFELKVKLAKTAAYRPQRPTEPGRLPPGHGYIYVLKNPSMPGLVKIGFTDRSVKVRAEELSSASGVPTPFTIHGQVASPNVKNVERKIHSILRAKRLSGSREFFRIDPDEALNVIQTEVEKRAKWD